MSEKHTQFYQYRMFVFLGMSLGWFMFYFCRKSFVASMPDLVRHRGLDKTDLGAISSGFTITYGVSKLVSGVLSDRLGGKLLLTLGLLASGICCIIFPHSDSVLMLAVVWGCNGLIQGLGWPGCAKLLQCWYPRNEIATWWSLLSAAGNFGATMTPLTFAFVSYYFGWESAFRITGLVACIVGLLLWLFLSNSPPQHLNVPSFLRDTENSQADNSRWWYEVLLEFDLWIVCFSYFILNMIRYCVTDWSQLYYIEAANVTEASAAGFVSMYQVGGVAGSILIGYLSDMFLGQKGQARDHPRAPALFLISIFVIGVLHMLSVAVLPGVSEFVLSAIQFCAGGFIEGSNTIIGVAAMDCVVPELTGSSHALASFIAQFGAFFAGFPFGYLIKTLSWNYAFLMLESVAIVNILFCSYLLVRNYSSGSSRIAVKQE